MLHLRRCVIECCNPSLCWCGDGRYNSGSFCNVPEQQASPTQITATTLHTHCIGIRCGLNWILPFLWSLNVHRLLIVLTSGLYFDAGGHTAEMMNLLSVLQEDRFKPRFYIAAATDNMSLQKARVFEDSLVQKVYLLTFISIFCFLKMLFPCYISVGNCCLLWRKSATTIC